MRRRSVLRALGAMALSTGPAAVTLEALRHGLSAAVRNHVDEWEQIVTDYGYAFYTTAADELMEQVTADLAVLQTVLAADTTARRPALLRVAGQLSVIVALGLVSSGQPYLARRWWATADRLADESGDPDARVLTWAWNVVNGCYDGRPLDQAIAVSDQALPLANDRPTAATCGLLAGRAQALARAGRHTEATATVERLADVTEGLPAAVVGEVESLWGWPEHRLRHTESYVHTHTGALAKAEAAQDRVLELYPASQVRLRTQVQLHRATCLIKGGCVSDGLRYAADVIDGLPSEQHNQVVYAVARQVAAVVPAPERRQPVFGELTARFDG
ncbi:hypothetical protein H4W31_001502 [Plantactinospora soyae]|uniref:XRE family transcriptional regulator n=2 Tax=Plantactinospora soyae TaxID=1544732 RepID=A0A927R3T8_9ACTN|nr:hypothetical protein [Plantactinospora soyae]